MKDVGNLKICLVLNRLYVQLRMVTFAQFTPFNLRTVSILCIHRLRWLTKHGLSFTGLSSFQDENIILKQSFLKELLRFDQKFLEFNMDFFQREISIMSLLTMS